MTEFSREHLSVVILVRTYHLSDAAGRLFMACLPVAAPAGLYQWLSALTGTQDLLSASLPQLQSSLLMKPVDVKECFLVCPPKIHDQKWINL